MDKMYKQEFRSEYTIYHIFNRDINKTFKRQNNKMVPFFCTYDHRTSGTYG